MLHADAKHYRRLIENNGFTFTDVTYNHNNSPNDVQLLNNSIVRNIGIGGYKGLIQEGYIGFTEDEIITHIFY